MKNSSRLYGVSLIGILCAGAVWLHLRASAGSADNATTQISSHRPSVHPNQTRSSSDERNPSRRRNANQPTGRSGHSDFDPTSAIAAYQAEPDPLKKNLLFAQMLMDMTADSATEILTSLKESGPSGRWDIRSEMKLFFQAWGQLDGEAAITAAKNMPNGKGYPESAILSWVGTDTAAATAWLNTQAGDSKKDLLTLSYIKGLSTDTAASTNYVLSLPEGKNATENRQLLRYYEMITQEQLKKGINATKTWADTLPDGDFKSSALQNIVNQIASEDIDTAKEWITHYADRDFAKEAVGKIAQRMTSTVDPETAVDWAQTLPEVSQESAFYSTLNQWAESDPTAAGTFLLEMPDSPSKNSAISGFVEKLQNQDPATAAAWATTITDEPLRRRAVIESSIHWYQENQTAADAFMAENGLSESSQELIRGLANESSGLSSGQ